MRRKYPHKAISNRISYIGGQWLALRKMLREKRHPADVFALVKAIEGATSTLISQHLEKDIRGEINARIVRLSVAGQLSPEEAQMLDDIKKHHAQRPFGKLGKALFYLRKLEQKLR